MAWKTALWKWRYRSMLIWLDLHDAICHGWCEYRLPFDCGLVNVALILKHRRPASCFSFENTDGSTVAYLLTSQATKGNFWPRSYQQLEVPRAVRSNPVLINLKSFRHHSWFSLIAVFLNWLVDSAAASRFNVITSLLFLNCTSEMQISYFKCHSFKNYRFAWIHTHTQING